MSEEEKTAEVAAVEETEAAPAAKKARKKWPIVVGVVVAVLVVAGAGFWVWHEQPSFCNAICHTPMDPYLPTYEATPGEPATDKWGNELETASGMLDGWPRCGGGAAQRFAMVAEDGSPLSWRIAG